MPTRLTNTNKLTLSRQLLSCALMMLTMGFGTQAYGFLFSNDDPVVVTVAEPFVDMRTGPGKQFPIYHVVEQGEALKVLKKRTTWYKVEGPKNNTGWISSDDFERTIASNGQLVSLTTLSVNDFSNRRWETGVLFGSFSGANSTTLYGGYQFTENLSLELSQTQVVGPFSDNSLQLISITHSAFPEWKYSPFFTLGTGTISTKPNATIVQPEDRDDDVMRMAVGMRMYLNRHFFLRAEYNAYTLLTSRNDNEEIEEWRIGFSVFF